MGSGIYHNGTFYGGTFDYDELKNKPSIQTITVTETGDIYIGNQLVRKVLSQAEYDALVTKDPKVEYLVPEETTNATLTNSLNATNRLLGSTKLEAIDDEDTNEEVKETEISKEDTENEIDIESESEIDSGIETKKKIAENLASDISEIPEETEGA